MVKEKSWVKSSKDAKQKHRPKLKDWSRDGFATHRQHEFDLLGNSPSMIREVSTIQELVNDPPTATSPVCKLSCSILSVENFKNFFETPSIPCLISDIPQSDNWPAHTSWRLSNKNYFRKKLGKGLFKVGEDDDGYKVKMKMKHFYKYMKNNVDDSPLYVFDSNYDNNPVSKCLLSDYKVPSYFQCNYFDLISEKRRPPYRWFLMGPSRSGTTMHVDPLGTSAWNTSIEGRKLWVLFPPDAPKSIIKGLDVIRKGEDDESINYFVDLLPRIKQVHGERVHPIELIQYPGDTIFVPSGWWHAVLNLDHTVAITQV